MALSGFIYGSFSGVSTSWARPVIYWSATQNIGANSSTITASLRYYKYITGVKSFNLDAPTTSINIGGNTTSSAQDIDLRSVAVNGYTTVWSRTRTITHGSDGSLSVAISASGSTGTSLGNITGLSGTAQLNNIPRASVLTRFTLGSQLEYNVANTISADVDIKYSGFYHRLRLEHTDGTLIWQSDTVYSSSSYTITASQVNAILNKIPSSKSATVRLKLYTYSNSARTAQVGNTSTSSNRTWTVNANQSPSMLETAPVNNRASIYSGFMQHQSRASFSFTATAKYGTSIASYKTVLKYPNGTTQTWNARTATSGILTQTGTHTVTYTATDRRGYSTSSSNTFSVVTYTYPKIASFTAQRNKTTPTTINVYRSVSGIGHSITKTVQVRYRKTGTSSWTTLNTQPFTASSYSGSLSLTNTDLRSSYEFELVLTDGYGQKATATRTVGTDSVFIHYDRDKGIGIGKYRENGALDVSGDIYANGLDISKVSFNGNLTALGHTSQNREGIVTFNSWVDYANVPFGTTVFIRNSSTAKPGGTSTSYMNFMKTGLRERFDGWTGIWTEYNTGRMWVGGATSRDGTVFFHEYLPLSGGNIDGTLKILGTVGDNRFITRGIQGSDGNGNLGDLYLNYGNTNNVTINGNTAYHTGNLPTTAKRWPSWGEVTGKSAQSPSESAEIPRNSNLNSYTTPGFYHSSYNADMATVKNHPSSVAGSLMVLQNAGFTQFWVNYATANTQMYVRNQYPPGGAWGNWRQF